MEQAGPSYLRWPLHLSPKAGLPPPQSNGLTGPFPGAQNVSGYSNSQLTREKQHPVKPQLPSLDGGAHPGPTEPPLLLEAAPD